MNTDVEIEVRSLTHDIVSPLTAAKLNLELLQQSMPEKSAELIDALQSLKRIESLLGVNFNQAVKGKSWRLAKLVAELSTEYENQLDLIQVDFVLAVDDGLRIKGNRIVFERILRNLIENSLKALSKTKPVQHRIWITGKVTKTKNVIDFADSGSGIKVKTADQLFKAPLRKSKNSHGFGLFAVALNLMKFFAGQIRLRRKLLKKAGNIPARFRIVLPI